MIGRKKNTSSRLRQRLALQQESQSADGAGGYVRSWSTVANLWAEMIPLAGRERLVADQLQSSVTHKILLRYRSGVTAGMRLLFESRIFNIRSVADVREEGELLELLVEEGVS